MKNFILPYILLATSSLALAQSNPKADARAEALKVGVEQFTLAIKYHGNADKPFYSLTLSVPAVIETRTNPFHPRVQITADEANAIIEHLKDDFLINATQMKAEASTPESAADGYTITLRNDALMFTEDIPLSAELGKRLDKLQEILKGESKMKMDQLIARLQGFREEWKKNENVPVQEANDKNGPMTVSRAVKITNVEIEKLDWKLGAVIDPKPVDDGFTVTAWRVVGYFKDGKPQFTPGGHRVIRIDKQGKVTGNIPGA